MYLKLFLVSSFFFNVNLIAVSHNENIAPSTNKPKSFYKKSDSLSVDKNLKSNKNTKNKSFLKKYHKPLIIGLTIATVVSLAALTYFVTNPITPKKYLTLERIDCLIRALSPENHRLLSEYFALFTSSSPPPINVSSIAEQKEMQTILKEIDTFNKQLGNITDVTSNNDCFSEFAKLKIIRPVFCSYHIYVYKETDVIVKNP